jgi:GNAT superfamily N-acetyltransferase
MALASPEAVEGAHMGHPDFRVGGKIFATLTPERGLAMVTLTPEQQEILCAAEPAIFAPVPGGWGRRGSTHIRLAAADAATLESALIMAYRNVAPKRLAASLKAAPHGASTAAPPHRLSIRKARRSEVAALGRLIRSALEVTNSRDYAPAVILALTANFSDPEVERRMRVRLVYVALSKGEIVGTVSLAASRVHSVFVDPARQGQGIGAALMAFIEKVARRQGHQRLELTSSLTAVSFYRKLGYRGSRRKVRQGGIETVLMGKALGNE